MSVKLIHVKWEPHGYSESTWGCVCARFCARPEHGQNKEGLAFSVHKIHQGLWERSRPGLGSVLDRLSVREAPVRKGLNKGKALVL